MRRLACWCGVITMVAALVVVAVPAARAEAVPVGDPVALGSLTGTDTVSHATSVNEQGDVVGWSWVAPGQRHAFIRFHGAATLVDLGTLGGSNAVANGVNGLGEVTGSSELPGDTVTHAFLWSASGGMVDQGTLGGTNSYGYGIDDVHHIVGTSQITGDGASHAFIVPGPFDVPLAGMTELATLGGGTNSTAYGVGPGGIYGSSDVGGTEPCPYHPADSCNITHAVSFNFHFTGFPGEIVDLGVLPGGRSSVAYGSNRVTIFGSSEVGTTDDEPSHAVRWTTSGMDDLGTLPGDRHAAARGINDAGLIVGTSDDQATSCGDCDGEGGRVPLRPDHLDHDRAPRPACRG